MRGGFGARPQSLLLASALRCLLLASATDASSGPVRLTIASTGSVQLSASRAPPRISASRTLPRISTSRAPHRARSARVPSRGELPQENFGGGPYNICLGGWAQSQGHGTPWPTWKNKGHVSSSTMVSRAPWSAKASRVPGSTMGHRPGGHLSGLQVPENSRAPTPPPRCYYYGASRAFREGEVMSQICLSCSLSNHSARPHLVSLIIDWAHLQSLTSTLHKLTHLCHSSAGLKAAWLQLSTLVDVLLSARLSLELVSAGGHASLQTVDTVHPASRTFFIVSLLLEALPELL